ncbi:Rrf2 family transcriptional regulator [uncultured Eudoraea sp.]|jgi:Rrf2 family protein|uniref:RrF2 family transcriptional regulator n=1 Tax=uncultured Eudoraea sp. TaxID=1035614 RepID=UPI002627479B|nr:Rrf2 family transcriptional regulator [uncultured Eudoraea sp.]
MLSNSSKYALKAVLYLALHTDENNKMMVKDISERINLPKAYIAKLLQELSKRKIISSTRGPKGGFYVTPSNKNETVMQIIEVIDGKKRMETCMLGLEDCNEQKPCPIHRLISPSRSKMITLLENKTINDLAKDLELNKTFLPV